MVQSRQCGGYQSGVASETNVKSFLSLWINLLSLIFSLEKKFHIRTFLPESQKCGPTSNLCGEKNTGWIVMGKSISDKGMSSETRKKKFNEFQAMRSLRRRYSSPWWHQRGGYLLSIRFNFSLIPFYCAHHRQQFSRCENNNKMWWFSHSLSLSPQHLLASLLLFILTRTVAMGDKHWLNRVSIAIETRRNSIKI